MKTKKSPKKKNKLENFEEKKLSGLWINNINNWPFIAMLYCKLNNFEAYTIIKSMSRIYTIIQQKKVKLKNVRTK